MRAFGQAIHIAQSSKYVGLKLTAKQVKAWNPNRTVFLSKAYLKPSNHGMCFAVTNNLKRRVHVQ
jgi:hypothetical protein